MNSNSNLPALSSIPQYPDMLSSHLRSTGGENGNQRNWIAVFDYPDCVREFDGKKWSIVLDKRIPRYDGLDWMQQAQIRAEQGEW